MTDEDIYEQQNQEPPLTEEEPVQHEEQEIRENEWEEDIPADTTQDSETQNREPEQPAQEVTQESDPFHYSPPIKKVAFDQLLELVQTEEGRARLYQVKNSQYFTEDDPLWLLFYVFEFYARVFKETEENIARATQKVISTYTEEQIEKIVQRVQKAEQEFARKTEQTADRLEEKEKETQERFRNICVEQLRVNYKEILAKSAPLAERVFFWNKLAQISRLLSWIMLFCTAAFWFGYLAASKPVPSFFHLHSGLLLVVPFACTTICMAFKVVTTEGKVCKADIGVSLISLIISVFIVFAYAKGY